MVPSLCVPPLLPPLAHFLFVSLAFLFLCLQIKESILDEK